MSVDALAHLVVERLRSGNESEAGSRSFQHAQRR
jgi:hypothetical protein